MGYHLYDYHNRTAELFDTAEEAAKYIVEKIKEEVKDFLEGLED